MREVFRAVHREELARYLQHIGILEAMEVGEIHCTNCGQLVDLENLGMILREHDHYSVFCTSDRCMLCCGPSDSETIWDDEPPDPERT